MNILKKERVIMLGKVIGAGVFAAVGFVVAENKKEIAKGIYSKSIEYGPKIAIAAKNAANISIKKGREVAGELKLKFNKSELEKSFRQADEVLKSDVS